MKQHRAGQWNLRLGRATRKIPALLRRKRLDWLAVQELNQRGPWLQRRLNEQHRAGRLPAYTVVVAADGDSALIIRDGIEWGAPRSHHMGRVEWERKSGRPGLHPARVSLSVRIGPRRGGYRVLVGHMPPGPDSRPLRAKARARYLERVDVLGARWTFRLRLAGYVVAADWNASRRHPMIRQLARRLGARTIGHGVDYPLFQGVVVSRHRAVGWLRDWSDHRPRVYTITD